MVIITLLTDYGPGTEHVGALHAVLAARCPDADRIDLAHDLPPGDVRMGAVVLARLVPLAPVGVHVAVVDPGVGTARRGVAVALTDGRYLVGPDNGVLHATCAAIGVSAAVELVSPAHRREPIAPTFHGRDVFAPAAAHLAEGGALDDLGPRVDPASLARADLPSPRVGAGRLDATVLGVDRFGNVQLLAGAGDLAAAGLGLGDEIRLGDGDRSVALRIGRVFADVPAGALVTYVDAHGHVAVAVNGGSATARLGIHAGVRITLRRA